MDGADSDRGLVIVPAGAGAGKTHRIKTQLSDWVKRKIVRPERILAVTCGGGDHHDLLAHREGAVPVDDQRILERPTVRGLLRDLSQRAFASNFHSLE